MEVFMRRELCRIDENTHHHTVGVFRRDLHKAQMAFMQRAHRRHKRNALAPFFPAVNNVAKALCVADGQQRAIMRTKRLVHI
jgi:hypothetical protein